MLNQISTKNYLLLAWLIGLSATLGSLFFQYGMHFPPCVLCWFQRITLYPMAVLFGVALWRRDKNVIYYAIPLLVIGWLIASYHVLLYYNIIPEAIAPCTAGISCTTKFIEWLGFITIPLLSWLGHSALLIICFIIKRKPSYEIGS